MQTTVRELQRGAASAGCADCHMPKTQGSSSHDFQRVRDPAWLRSKLQITARARRDGGAQFVLRAVGVGHAFPTGDLFRRLKLEMSWHAANGQTLESQRSYLARHFVHSYGQLTGRQLKRDNRVFKEPRVVDLVPAKGHRSATMRWALSLQRVIDSGRGDDPDKAQVDSEVLLHRGTIRARDR